MFVGFLETKTSRVRARNIRSRSEALDVVACNRTSSTLKRDAMHHLAIRGLTSRLAFIISLVDDTVAFGFLASLKFSIAHYRDLLIWAADPSFDLVQQMKLGTAS